MSIGDDLLKELNLIADSATTERRTRDFKATVSMMARRGYKFSRETLEIAKRLCDGEGLMLQGPVGVGKSFFFYAAKTPALSLELAMGRSLDDLNRALRDWQDEDILIDDVGKGDGEIVSYGQRIQLLPYIIERRMESCAVTHVTTNLTPDQLLEKYGARTTDRLTQLCSVVELKGESLRRPGGARTADWYEDFFKGRLWCVCSRCCKCYDDDSRRCLKGVEYEPRSVDRGCGAEPCCQYF